MIKEHTILRKSLFRIILTSKDEELLENMTHLMEMYPRQVILLATEDLENESTESFAFPERR